MSELIPAQYQAPFLAENGEIDEAWKTFFNNLNAILSFKNNHERTFTPSFTSLTDTGTPSYSADYRIFNGMLFFSYIISTDGNTSSTAGTTYIDLPLKPDNSGNKYVAKSNGECVINNLSTKTSIGTGLVERSGSKVWLPSWTTVSNDISISGSVRINDES